MRRSRASLGLKLNLALLVFFIVLGAATAAFVFIGFNRSRDNATARSEEALEELGKLALQALVGGATESGGLQFESAAEIGPRAARYMETVRQQSPVAFDSSRLAQTEEGLYYDPDPARTADLIVLNHLPLDDAAVQDELSYAAALDAISLVLFEGFEDEVGGRNFDPNAIAFVGASGVAHYYPPRGIHEVIPPDLDTSALMARVGPVDNPERRTLWRAPYEDSAGQGLVVTAETPVYEGDTFRGAIQVDLLISKLIDQVNGIRPTPGGFAFYVDTNGDLLKSDHFDLLSGETEVNPRLASILDGMKSNEGDFNVTVETIVLEGRQFFVAYAPMLSLGGSFAVAAPVDEVTAQAAAITAEIDEQADRTMLLVLGSMTVLFALALVAATYLNRRVLVRPIAALLAGTRAVATGDFDTRIAVRGNDELAALGHSFNQMTSDIQREVQEREATQSELAALFAAMTDAVVVIDEDGLYLRVPSTNAPAILLPPEDLPGKHMREVMPAKQADEFLTVVKEALSSGRTATVEYPLEIDDRTYWFSAAVSPISEREVVVVARDITERVTARQELERQVEERTRELRLLLDVSQNVASTLGMRELAGTILSQLWTVIGFDGAALMLLQDDGARVFESPTGNEDAPGVVVDRLTTAPPGGTGQMAIERRAPVAVADVEDDPKLAAWVAQIPGRANVGRSWLSAPLIAQDRVLGVLNFWSLTPGRFGEQHTDLAMAVANQTAVAIENARLFQEASVVAAVEERQRLARELHDSVSQALYGIALGARTARTLLDSDPARATEPVDYVLQLAEAGLAEMRALIFELRPESLETEGLVAALEKQVAATRARYGIEVEASLPEEPSLSLPEKEVFYRIAQEALHNVVKHARASRVEVTLSANNGSTSLEVRDNGVGFDASQSFPGHMGLVSFTERASSIGARVEVESAPGAGTAVRLSLG